MCWFVLKARASACGRRACVRGAKNSVRILNPARSARVGSTFVPCKTGFACLHPGHCLAARVAEFKPAHLCRRAPVGSKARDRMGNSEIARASECRHHSRLCHEGQPTPQPQGQSAQDSPPPCRWPLALSSAAPPCHYARPPTQLPHYKCCLVSARRCDSSPGEGLSGYTPHSNRCGPWLRGPR